MPPNIWGQKGYMMAEMYYAHRKIFARTREDFTRFQPAKNQWKKPESQLMLRRAYPCSVKNTSYGKYWNRSNMYTSITELKVHSESSEQGPERQVCINVHVSHIESWSKIIQLDVWSSNWISKYRIIRGGSNGTITQLGDQHIRCCCAELQHIRVDGNTGRNWENCQQWTEKCWCNPRSSPITTAQFYTLGINELKSTMWEIVGLPGNDVSR